MSNNEITFIYGECKRDDCKEKCVSFQASSNPSLSDSCTTCYHNIGCHRLKGIFNKASDKYTEIPVVSEPKALTVGSKRSYISIEDEKKAKFAKYPVATSITSDNSSSEKFPKDSASGIFQHTAKKKSSGSNPASTGSFSKPTSSSLSADTKSNNKSDAGRVMLYITFCLVYILIHI